MEAQRTSAAVRSAEKMSRAQTGLFALRCIALRLMETGDCGMQVRRIEGMMAEKEGQVNKEEGQFDQV